LTNIHHEAYCRGYDWSHHCRFSDAQTLFDNTITTSVNTARAAVNTAPPGAVQSGIDFTALGAADLYFLQVAADVGLVFSQDFEAPISEALSAGILATSIIGAIEGAHP
jgi:hypothetical protein